MEQKPRRDASCPVGPWPIVGKEEFFKHVVVDKHSRFDLLFFILNTLYQIRNHGYHYCYCGDVKSFRTKIICNGVPYWLPSSCQICFISDYFWEFKNDVDKIRFNFVELRKYYCRLRKELIKCFYNDPFACKCFLGREKYSSGRDYREGTYSMVSLSENICYNDKIFLHNLESKKRDQLYGPF